MAQQDSFVFAFRHVLSMERLVQEVRGLQTPDVYSSLKHYAINKHTQWEAVVNRMEELSVLDRIEWCEVFLKDLLLLHKHTTVFEQKMVERGADLERQLGSQEHEDKKLHLLLYKGENAVFIEDVCEDVLLRSARRLRTLVNWAYAVRTVGEPCIAFHGQTLFRFVLAAQACSRPHTSLIERQRRDCFVVLETPPPSPVENRPPAVDITTTIGITTPAATSKRTWGQMLCGDGQPVVTLPQPRVSLRRLS